MTFRCSTCSLILLAALLFFTSSGSCYWRYIANAAISGHNDLSLTSVTLDYCKEACCENTRCKSFDYHKYSNACDLSFSSASDVGGLKTDYSGNPYDHYEFLHEANENSYGSCRWQHTRNAAIRGHSMMHLGSNGLWGGVTVQVCKETCCSLELCKSFDYYKESSECDLFASSAADVGGLQTSNYNYDHYAAMDSDCGLGTLDPSECRDACGVLTQPIVTPAKGSGTCSPATHQCHSGEGSCIGDYHCHRYQSGESDAWCQEAGSNYVFTRGNNGNYPGCGDCWCCKLRDVLDLELICDNCYCKAQSPGYDQDTMLKRLTSTPTNLDDCVEQVQQDPFCGSTFWYKNLGADYDSCSCYSNEGEQNCVHQRANSPWGNRYRFPAPCSLDTSSLGDEYIISPHGAGVVDCREHQNCDGNIVFGVTCNTNLGIQGIPRASGTCQSPSFKVSVVGCDDNIDCFLLGYDETRCNNYPGQCYWHSNRGGCLNIDEYIYKVKADIALQGTGPKESKAYQIAKVNKISNLDNEEVVMPSELLTIHHTWDDSAEISDSVTFSDSKETSKSWEQMMGDIRTDNQESTAESTMTEETNFKVSANTKVFGIGIDAEHEQNWTEEQTTSNSVSQSQENTKEITDALDEQLTYEKDESVENTRSYSESKEESCGFGDLPFEPLEVRYIIAEWVRVEEVWDAKVVYTMIAKRGNKTRARPSFFGTSTQTNVATGKCQVENIPDESSVLEHYDCNFIRHAVSDLDGGKYRPTCIYPEEYYAPLQMAKSEAWCSYLDGRRYPMAQQNFARDPDCADLEDANCYLNDRSQVTLDCASLVLPESALCERAMAVTTLLESTNFTVALEDMSVPELYAPDACQCGSCHGRQKLMKVEVQPGESYEIVMETLDFDAVMMVRQGNQCPGTGEVDSMCGQTIRVSNDIANRQLRRFWIGISTNANRIHDFTVHVYKTTETPSQPPRPDDEESEDSNEIIMTTTSSAFDFWAISTEMPKVEEGSNTMMFILIGIAVVALCVCCALVLLCCFYFSSDEEPERKRFPKTEMVPQTSEPGMGFMNNIWEKTTGTSPATPISPEQDQI